MQMMTTHPFKLLMTSDCSGKISTILWFVKTLGSFDILLSVSASHHYFTENWCFLSYSQIQRQRLRLGEIWVWCWPGLCCWLCASCWDIVGLWRVSHKHTICHWGDNTPHCFGWEGRTLWAVIALKGILVFMPALMKLQALLTSSLASSPRNYCRRTSRQGGAWRSISYAHRMVQRQGICWPSRSTWGKITGNSLRAWRLSSTW